MKKNHLKKNLWVWVPLINENTPIEEVVEEKHKAAVKGHESQSWGWTGSRSICISIFAHCDNISKYNIIAEVINETKNLDKLKNDILWLRSFLLSYEHLRLCYVRSYHAFVPRIFRQSWKSKFYWIGFLSLRCGLVHFRNTRPYLYNIKNVNCLKELCVYAFRLYECNIFLD